MRRHYLDNIRWATVLLVVFYHVIYMYNSESVAGGPGPFYDSQPWDVIQYMFYPWFMIILFLIGGISARLYLNTHNSNEFIKNRTMKLLVPSTLGVILLGWIQGYVNLLLSGAFFQMKDLPRPIIFCVMILSGTGVLWFLQLLWIYSLIAVFIRKFEKGRLFSVAKPMPVWLVVLLVIPLFISAQILNLPVIICYKFGVYLFAYLLGYFVFAHQTIIDALSRYWITFSVIAIALFCFYCRSYYGMNYADIPVFNSPLSIGFAWFAILAILAIANRFFNAETGVSRWFKVRSFGLYVFHYLGISTSAYLLYNFTQLPVILIYIFTLLAGLVVGYGLNWIVSRIPFIRWILLGM